MINPEQFLQLIKEEKEQSFKIGTVATVAGNKAKIIFDGETVASGKGYLSVNYTPVQGHRVLLANVKGTYLILGKIG